MAGEFKGYRLDGKIALITGTGGGQGRAAAVLFAANGATIVGCDVNAAANDETVGLVRAAGGKMSGSGAVDVADPKQAQAWVDAAAREHGRIDIVYNNGSAAKFGGIAELSIEDWQFTMRNEADLVFYVSRYAWPHLVENKGGVIISTASVAGHAGSKASPMVPHAAAKGAVLAMTKQMAVEGAQHGIRCVSISPGAIETPGTREMLKDPKMLSVVLAKALIPRVGQPEEIAQMALFLASDAASYITGADFIVDGGAMAH